MSVYAKTTSKDRSPKDSSLIYAWNAFCRVFISVLRYLSSFAAVDVSLTHSYWYGQAFAAFNPSVTETNSLKNLHRFDILVVFNFYKICLYFCVWIITHTLPESCSRQLCFCTVYFRFSWSRISYPGQLSKLSLSFYCLGFIVFFDYL